MGERGEKSESSEELETMRTRCGLNQIRLAELAWA